MLTLQGEVLCRAVSNIYIEVVATRAFKPCTIIYYCTIIIFLEFCPLYAYFILTFSNT